MNQQHQLRAWLARATPVALAGVVDDTHIDELDPRLKHRDLWLAGVQRIFDAAAAVYASAGDTRCVLAAALTLQSGEDATGINFTTRAELARELNQYTPPSLYLLRHDAAAWFDSGDEFVVLSPRLKLCATRHAVVRYCEYESPEETDYRRSLWFTLPPRVFGRSAAGDSC